MNLVSVTERKVDHSSGVRLICTRVKADASNTYLDEQDLFVANAYVDEGTTLKRFQPRAQGRAFRINKRTSHITVVLSTPDELAGANTAGSKKASK